MLSPARKNSRHRDQVCVLDLGSQTLRAALFACGIDGQPPEVLGVARRASAGIGAGAVIDLPALSVEVAGVINQLEHMADQRVSRVVVVVTHPSLHVAAANGLATVAGQLVQPRDCRRAEAAARERFQRRRQRLIHEAVQCYRLDGRSYRERPHALKGQRLEVDVQHVSICEATIENLVRAVRAAKVQVEAVCSNLLAAATAALSDEERKAGAALLELGAQGTTASVYANGHLVAARSERGGAQDLSMALSRGLLLPFKNAERVKMVAGKAAKDQASDTDLIEVETIGLREPRQLSRSLIAEAMEPVSRAHLQRLASLVSQTGMANELSAGLVLCGNGAKLEGIADLAEQSLAVPVRIATPRGLLGLAELLDQPGDCCLAGAAMLWARDELASWETPQRRARARRNVQPRWLDLLA